MGDPAEPALYLLGLGQDGSPLTLAEVATSGPAEVPEEEVVAAGCRQHRPTSVSRGR